MQSIGKYKGKDFVISIRKTYWPIIFQILNIRVFFDSINSQGFVPQINKPTRISCETTTMIDNIFTNDIDVCK